MIPGIVAAGAMGSSGPPVIVPTMLDPLNTGSGITLSNLNLTATKSSATAWKMSRSVLGVTTGKYYFEVTWNEFSGSFVGVGLGDQDASVENFYGADGNGLILINNGEVYRGGALATTIQTSAEGSVTGVAFDVDAELVWFRTGAGDWNNSPTADPETGTGGIAFGASHSGTTYAGVGVQTAPNDQMTANFGPTFSGTPPAGFGILGESDPPGLLGLGGITEDA